MFRVRGSWHRVCCSYRDVSCSRSGIFVKRLLLPLQGVQSSLVGVSENQVSDQRDPQSIIENLTLSHATTNFPMP